MTLACRQLEEWDGTKPGNRPTATQLISGKVQRQASGESMVSMTCGITTTGHPQRGKKRTSGHTLSYTQKLT